MCDSVRNMACNGAALIRHYYTMSRRGRREHAGRSTRCDTVRQRVAPCGRRAGRVSRRVGWWNTARGAARRRVCQLSEREMERDPPIVLMKSVLRTLSSSTAITPSTAAPGGNLTACVTVLYLLSIFLVFNEGFKRYTSW